MTLHGIFVARPVAGDSRADSELFSSYLLMSSFEPLRSQLWQGPTRRRLTEIHIMPRPKIC